MKSYVLTGLNQDQLRALKSNGVTFFNWKDSGVLIPDEDTLRLALKILQAEGIENATDMEGVFNVYLEYPNGIPESPPVLDEVYHSARELLEQLPRLHQTDTETDIDPLRTVRLEPGRPPAQEIVGQAELTAVQTQTNYSPQGEPQSGTVTSGTDGSVYPANSKLARLALNSEWLASRVRYIAACAARVQELIVQAKERLLSKRIKLPAAEDRFAKLTRQAAFAPNTVTEEELRVKFANEIALVKETAKVMRVRVTNAGGAILIYTDTLYATAIDCNEKHEIGKFLIRILPDASSDSIRFYNATRRVNGIRPGMNAPYVLADGTIISDEIKQTFLDLIARCDFAALADLAIQFIETVNDDAPGRFITRWPGTDLTSFQVN